MQDAGCRRGLGRLLTPAPRSCIEHHFALHALRALSAHSAATAASPSLSPQVIKKTFCPDRSIVTAVKVCASGLLSTAGTTGTPEGLWQRHRSTAFPIRLAQVHATPFLPLRYWTCAMAAGRRRALVLACVVAAWGVMVSGAVAKESGRTVSGRPESGHTLSRFLFPLTADDEDVLEEPIEAPPASAPSPRELPQSAWALLQQPRFVAPEGATTAVPAGYSTTPYNTNAPGNAGEASTAASQQGAKLAKIRRMPIRRRAA